jgi:hypothetical protein
MLTNQEINIILSALTGVNSTTSEAMQAVNIIREKLEWMRPNDEKEPIENGDGTSPTPPAESQTV